MSASNLLKVLIVDDEHLVRNLLKKCIDWNEIGYEIVGEASNAHEALDLVDALRPDLIFTDIYMPFMDGLEFGKLVFEKYSNIKIVVLTGYEEFEYAKKSIKIGIADFLLKPINDDEIRRVALTMKEKIEAERNHRAEYDRMKKQLEENLPYLREKLLNKLIQNGMEDVDIHQELEYFHISLNPTFVQVAVIEATLSDVSSNSGEEERIVLNMQCQELVSKYFRDTSKTSALACVIFAQIWMHMGYSMIINLAGLQSIPRDLYEAGEIDGTSPSQKFKYITFPLLWSTINANILLAVIGSLQAYQVILLTTGGTNKYSNPGCTGHVLCLQY